MPSFEVSLPDLRASGPVIQAFIGPSRELVATLGAMSEFALHDILAIEAPLTGQSIQCLIGRDVLSRGVLAYSGVDNLFRLTF